MANVKDDGTMFADDEEGENEEGYRSMLMVRNVLMKNTNKR